MTRRLLPFLLLVLCAGTQVLDAQGTQQNAERRKEAERQLVEAQRQVEIALQRVRAGTEEAREQLEQAIQALRAAQRELYRGMVLDVVVEPRRQGERSIVYGADWPAVAVFERDRPMIGVLMSTDRDAAVDSLGVKISAVTPGGPADEAGIKVGDVFIEANGQSLARRGRSGVDPGDRLVEIVQEVKEGDSLRVRYRRGTQTQTAVIKPRRMGGNAFAYAFGDSMVDWAPRIRTQFVEPSLDLRAEPGELISRLAVSGRWMDMELVTLNSELGSYFGTTEGLLVVRAPRDSAIGLKSGDVILRMDGRAPTSPSHALRILRSYEAGERVSLEIMRDKRKQTVSFSIPTRDRERERDML